MQLTWREGENTHPSASAVNVDAWLLVEIRFRLPKASTAVLIAVPA
jgi:hypothetical protein